jgi:dihydroorotate dehydrogenase
MYQRIRPLLFRLDPEAAHQLTLNALRVAGNFSAAEWFLKQLYKTPSKPVQAFGLTFKNPVGLAAGYDKDALAINGLSALGFGHLEIGTVTPKPQPGNPSPRVFRLLEDDAVINRMGFPSQGMLKVEGRMLALSRVEGLKVSGRRSVVVGVNLGKNKDTPLEEAVNDYIELMKIFAPLADYLTINISSPNTVGLRRLQSREMLEKLLGQINLEHETWNAPALRAGASVKRPILVKIAPDLTDEELDDAVGVILDKGMDGVIATNTTLARDGLRSKHQSETGGLSGSPLTVKSEAILSRVVKLVNGRVPIISAGGIMSPEDAKKRLALGASLVQIYTGLVYRGPGLVREIVESI